MSTISIFLTTFNTNLRASEISQNDLKAWLLPELQLTANKTHQLHDIYAIAVQELLPLHWALAGLSGSVVSSLATRFQDLLSSHATASSGASESYNLLAQVTHAGVALWLFGREATLGGRLGKIQTTSLGVGFPPLGMGNKAAVAARLFVDRGIDHPSWESFTFVSAHFEAHDYNVAKRNANYQTLQTSLLFPSTDVLDSASQIHETSHLYVLGDLNYRLRRLPQGGIYPQTRPADADSVRDERAALVEVDTLLSEQSAGRVFGGLREGDLRSFAPTYKRINGSVEGYSRKRLPGYTDRILLASYNDAPVEHYQSTESVVLSDHKPVHAIVRIPPGQLARLSPHSVPKLRPPPSPHPSRPAPADAMTLFMRKSSGLIADRVVGFSWCFLSLLGAGDARLGAAAVVALVLGWTLWHAVSHLL